VSATKDGRPEYVGGPCCGLTPPSNLEAVLIVDDPQIGTSNGRPIIVRGRFRYVRTVTGDYWLDAEL
jgi:hypothetical protein